MCPDRQQRWMLVESVGQPLHGNAVDRRGLPGHAGIRFCGEYVEYDYQYKPGPDMVFLSVDVTTPEGQWSFNVLSFAQDIKPNAIDVNL